MLSNAVIGLREGLEAALVVGILLAYLTKTNREALKRAVWTGVGAAVLLSVAVSVLLQQVSHDLSERASEIFAGGMSIATVGLVTWMVFWMRRTARGLRAELHGKLDSALAVGTTSVALLAFVAVAREGVETSLFLWTSVSAGQNAVSGTFGALLGLAIAIGLGRLVVQGAIKMDLSKFFRVSGAALVVVAGAVLSYGIAELQEAHVVGGEDAVAFDFSAHVGEGSSLNTVISVLLGFGSRATWPQVLVWAAYVSTVLVMFLRKQKVMTKPVAAATPQPQPIGK